MLSSAYAFVEAIVVTPLGALSVVISAVLSSFFLNEKLTFFGWLGCALCILGSVIIALNGPQEQAVGQIRVFQSMFLSPGFLAWGSVLIAASLAIIFYFAPKYGKKQMIWYILVCSMIGGISVSVTTGLGAAIVQTAFGDNQFKFWFIYFLMAFVVITLITEVYYLNVALALFNTAMVTPTYYVVFTFFSIVTTIVLYKGLQSSASQIITLVMGFLVICVGITILQLSKIDPTNLSTKLDRRSTLLLQAAREKTQPADEKSLTGLEDPGMDTLRGSFGAFGSMIRARTVRRMSQNSRTSKHRMRSTGTYDPSSLSWASDQARAGSPIQGLPLNDPLSGLKRHSLYDAPVPRDDASSVLSFNSASPRPTNAQMKRPTIKFDIQDLIHQYDRPGTGDNRATHEHRATNNSPALRSSAIPTPSDSRIPQTVASQIPKLPPPPGSPLFHVEIPELSSGDLNLEDTKRKLFGITTEQKIHSAPPTVSSRFREGQLLDGLPRRKDSIKDAFDLSDLNDPDATLKTFPSVTDSAESEIVWDDAELERQKELAKARDRAKSLGKRYPRASADDDAEESRSLWNRESIGGGAIDMASDSTETEHDIMDTSLAGTAGGIRLVKPRKGPEL